MLGPRFFVVFGISLLVFGGVAVLYLLWTRMIGLEPSVAKEYVKLSRGVRTLLAVGLGAVLGAAIEAVPTIESGIAVVTLLGASAFVGLMLFEIVGHRSVESR